MTAPIRINQNDTGIILTFFCRDEDGNPIDLTLFSVEFHLYDGDTELNASRTVCAKSDSAAGVAEYTITAEDTAALGILHGKLCLHGGSSVVHNLGSIPVEVRDSTT